MRRIFQILAAAQIFAMGALATPATASTVLISNVLTFAENLGQNPPAAVSIIDNGNGATSLVFDVGVTITAMAGPIVPPQITDAVFSLSGTSTNSATTTVIGGVASQGFSGTYAVDAPECGASGICLGGSFVSLMSGVVGPGSTLTLSASTPPSGALTMISDPNAIPVSMLMLPLSMTLTKTGLSSPVAVDCTSLLGCTLASNDADISGTFSAARIPEPSTWTMMLLGFAGLGFTSYRASRKSGS
jgi:PEP-CTERM motif